jgi:hypothetical protein
MSLAQPSRVIVVEPVRLPATAPAPVEAPRRAVETPAPASKP